MQREWYCLAVHKKTQLNSHVKLFADDCAIYNQVSCKADTSLQSDLNSLYTWCVKWQLNLNLPKCKALCISNKRSPPNSTYYINNVPLEWVSEFTYLGVKITSNLSWRSHILAKTTKANRTLNLLRRTMYSCGEGAKKRAYEALVRPQVEYCSAVWNPHLKKDVDVLEKLQRRAARWICCRWNKQTYKWSKTYSEAINHLGWKTLEDRRNIQICCQTYRIIHHLDCIPFDCYFSFVKHTATRSHALSLFCKPSCINAFRYSFFINAAFLWNTLPHDVMLSNSITSFRLRLNNH